MRVRIVYEVKVADGTDISSILDGAQEAARDVIDHIEAVGVSVRLFGDDVSVEEAKSKEES